MKLLLRWLSPTALVLATFIVYRPALSFELIGDDYQWVQLAHAAMHRPILLLSDLDTFYRPANTWTLMLDHTIWGFQAHGYHLTNVLLHAIVAVALALVAMRLGLPRIASWTVAFLWVSSSFTLEPAASVAIRFEDLLLLAWLGLALSWSKGAEVWTGRRIAAVTGCVLFAAASKESWVVTPLLVFALVWAQEHRSWLRALAVSGLAAGGAVAYSVVYFRVFPGDKNYFAYRLTTLARLPHQLSAFLEFETLRPLGFVVTWRSVLALALVAAAVIWLVGRRNTAGTVGATLLLAPMLPVLFVPYLPTRYTVIPYAGFLLVVAALLTYLIGSLDRPWCETVAASSLIVAVLLAAAGWFTVRADLSDLQRVSDAHAELLREARAVAPLLPVGQPLLAIRAEHNDPLRTIALSGRGLPKIYFPRPEDPYALADTAAFFEWARGDEGLLVRRIGDWRKPGFEPAALLIHRSGDFQVEMADAHELVRRAEFWASRGAPVKAFILQRVP